MGICGRRLDARPITYTQDINQYRMTSMRRILFLAGVLVSFFIAGCTDSPTSSSNQFSSIEQRAHELVNQYRASRGLAPLTFSETIASQARGHSREMSGGNLNHDGFQNRVDAINVSIPLSSAGENVALNSGFADPAQEAVTGWINSPPHRTNMEGDFDLTGIGVDKKSDGTFYFTQVFIKRR